MPLVEDVQPAGWRIMAESIRPALGSGQRAAVKKGEGASRKQVTNRRDAGSRPDEDTETGADR